MSFIGVLHLHMGMNSFYWTYGVLLQNKNVKEDFSLPSLFIGENKISLS